MRCHCQPDTCDTDVGLCLSVVLRSEENLGRNDPTDQPSAATQGSHFTGRKNPTDRPSAARSAAFLRVGTIRPTDPR